MEDKENDILIKEENVLENINLAKQMWKLAIKNSKGFLNLGKMTAR